MHFQVSQTSRQLGFFNFKTLLCQKAGGGGVEREERWSHLMWGLGWGGSGLQGSTTYGCCFLGEPASVWTSPTPSVLTGPFTSNKIDVQEAVPLYTATAMSASLVNWFGMAWIWKMWREFLLLYCILGQARVISKCSQAVFKLTSLKKKKVIFSFEGKIVLPCLLSIYYMYIHMEMVGFCDKKVLFVQHALVSNQHLLF